MRESVGIGLGVRIAHNTLQNITKHLSAFLPTCPLDFLIKWDLNFIKLGSHNSKNTTWPATLFILSMLYKFFF